MNNSKPTHQGRPNKGGFRPYRKKQCIITKNAIKKIEFTDVELLSNFIGKDGRILPCRSTSTKPHIQRQIARAIKRSRQMALLPYIENNK